MGKHLSSSHGDRHSSPVPITLKYWVFGKFHSELENHVLLLKISIASQPEHEREANYGSPGQSTNRPLEDLRLSFQKGRWYKSLGIKDPHGATERGIEIFKKKTIPHQIGSTTWTWTDRNDWAGSPPGSANKRLFSGRGFL